MSVAFSSYAHSMKMEKGKNIRREHQHTRGNPKDKEIPKKHDRRVERDHSSSSETDSESEFVFKSWSHSSKSMHSTLSPKSPGKSSLVEPALKKGEIYYRSILRTAINEITALRYDDEQLRELQRTPFWLFFNAIYKSDPKKLKSRVEKHEDTIRKIILCFDESIGRFVIGGKDVSFNNIDVNLIFGISGGSKRIPIRNYDYIVPNWIKRCFSREIENNRGHFVMGSGCAVCNGKWMCSLIKEVNVQLGVQELINTNGQHGED
ncbi:hypothetical protein ACS0TY_015338 [Phlomoides rotata]